MTVSFVAMGEATVVTLEHGGWENLADPADARVEYDGVWTAVLDSCAASPAAAADTELWFVLDTPPPEGGPVPCSVIPTSASTWFPADVG